MDKIDEHYFKDRYLLEDEYMKIMLSINKIKPSDVIISSNCLNGIFNHNNIASLHMCLDNSNVTILAYSKEYNVKHKRKEK